MRSNFIILLVLFISFFFGCGPSIKEDQSVELTKGIIQKTIYTETKDATLLEKYAKDNLVPNKDVYFFFFAKGKQIAPNMSEGKNSEDVNDMMCKGLLEEMTPFRCYEYENENQKLTNWSCSFWNKFKIARINSWSF